MARRKLLALVTLLSVTGLAGCSLCTRNTMPNVDVNQMDRKVFLTSVRAEKALNTGKTLQFLAILEQLPITKEDGTKECRLHFPGEPKRGGILWTNAQTTDINRIVKEANGRTIWIRAIGILSPFVATYQKNPEIDPFCCLNTIGECQVMLTEHHLFPKGERLPEK